MPNISIPRRIFAAIANRGYVSEWQLNDLLAWQACKLLEEAAELFLAFPWPCNQPARLAYLHGLAIATREAARAAFDDKAVWKGIGRGMSECHQVQIKSEAADVYVVLCVLSETQKINGHDYDLSRVALEKATADEGRGVRS